MDAQVEANVTTGRALSRRGEAATLPAILEFQSPSAAVISTAVPRSARGIVWIIGAMFATAVTALGLIAIDRVVVTQGKVISEAATIVVQPLETAIVRAIHVREGQVVKAG